jgi:hypothetical protein
VQPDPVAPTEWVERLFDELQIDYAFKSTGEPT